MARIYIPIDDLMRALAKYPDGVTTKVLADRIGLTPRNVASRLSKAFMWGNGVQREFRRTRRGRPECIWRLPQ